MISAKKARHRLLGLAGLLFLLSVFIDIASRVNPYLALMENVFGSFDIPYSVLSFTSAEKITIIATALLDVIVFALLTVVFASLFFDSITKIHIREHRVLRSMMKAKHHIIIAPYNSFAFETAKLLKEKGRNIVVGVSTRAEFEQLYRKDIPAIIGDPKDVTFFEACNAKNADFVIACDESDITNTLITMTAKTVKPGIKIISRLSNESNIPKLGLAGAYRMIMPEITAGERIGIEIAKRILE